jgi:hypothetical protein
MSKATPINQIQQDMQQPPLDNVDEVLNEMNQNDQGGYYNDQQQMAPPQQQMAPPQQQMMMAPMPNHQQMMPPMMMPPMMKQSQTTVERLMAELKEALVVAIVFIVLNFEPVSKALQGVLVRVSDNSMVLLLLKGVIAGVLFYGARRLVINN